MCCPDLGPSQILWKERYLFTAMLLWVNYYLWDIIFCGAWLYFPLLLQTLVLISIQVLGGGSTMSLLLIILVHRIQTGLETGIRSGESQRFCLKPELIARKFK